MTIQRLTAPEAANLLPDLIALLTNCVDSGASIGFLPPLPEPEARAYWLNRIDAVEHCKGALVVAQQQGRVVGSAQLAFETRANGQHRAEVQKVIVHTEHRRQGLARRMMMALEDIAHRERRHLLVLDTRTGDPAEVLYRSLGYQRVGEIPQFARNPSGQFDSTTVYYKLLV